MAELQGQPNAEPAAQQGQSLTEPAVVPAELQQFVVQTPNTTPAENQGEPQGEPEPQAGAIDPAKHFQSLADQRQAEIYRLQQQLLEVATRQQQPQVEKNPFDPQTQPEQYWDWKLDQKNRQLLDEARRLQREEFQTMIQQASEMTWQQQHPNVDINSVKAFARSRGITQLDDAYTLMTLPTTLNNARRTAINQTYNTVRQPEAGAQPLRGVSGSGNGQIGLSFEKLAEEFNAKNGNVNWPEGLMQAFQTEMYKRADAQRKR